MGTRAAQWHAGYNPVTHQGQGAPAPEKHRGVKITPKVATFASNLQGAACMPTETSAGASAAQPKSPSSPGPLIPARVDHLCGEACAPAAGACGETAERSHSPGQPSPKSKLLNLRAAVDHLSGEACCVRHVQEVATVEGPLPQVQRGMLTKLTKDRMLAQQAREHMNSSRLYNVGAGYTTVVASSHGAEGSPRE